jgi:isopentenyl-diphosphate Delta-isomerase
MAPLAGKSESRILHRVTPTPPNDRVVLVDENDATIGTQDKLRAHERGELHRACSVLVFNQAGELLLQRRAATKYHSPGLWSNTCCTHPRPGESASIAARRRLGEELGIDCELAALFRFVYRADVGDGLTEHEYDHVFVGRSEATPAPDPTEVDAWRWQSLSSIRDEMAHHPGRYTAWFHVLLVQPELRAAAL